MGRFSLAWRVLTSGDFARKVSALLSEPALPAPKEAAAKAAAATPIVSAKPPEPKPAARNDAVSLLATLQREGRLVDFLKEPIEGYSDAQIGAAVRDIHRDCGAVLERQFAIRPVLDQSEGSSVSLADHHTTMLKLSGNVSNNSAGTGALVHHGWKTTKCDVPIWTGDAASASIIAPAEVEVR